MKRMKNRDTRKTHNRRFLLPAVVFLIFLVTAAFLLYPKTTKRGVLCGPYRISKVFDGDTISVVIRNKETTIRMIGIDTPESVNRDQSLNTPEGLEVSLWVHNYLKGRKVWLEYDEQRYDRYGRTLAYIWLDEGETMLEDILLKNGMATALAIEPNLRYSSHFSELEHQAKQEKAGFWESGFFQ